MTAPEPPAEVVHACPLGAEGITPCCGRTPFELPRWSSRITIDPTLVTCTGGLGPNTRQQSTPPVQQAVDTLVSFAFRNAADDAGYVRLLDALRTLGVTANEIEAARPSDEDPPTASPSRDTVPPSDVAARGRALVFIGDQFEGGRAVVCGEKVHPDRICVWALDDNGNCPEHGPRDLPGTGTAKDGAS